MPTRRPSVRRAVREITDREPVIGELVARAGPLRLPRPLVPDVEGAAGHFCELCAAILYQQLAAKAAAAIHGRFVALFDGMPTAAGVLALSDGELRGAGLSGAKAASIQDLAAKVADGTVALDDLDALDDEEIVTRLTAVRGIGRWTAEMFLIFRLGRLDVWPVTDYGVRQGYALAFGLETLPSPSELLLLGERFRPYRTVVAWYCWRAVHLARGEP
jgi:DNA-3-methyladenine glycosylase II